MSPERIRNCLREVDRSVKRGEYALAAVFASAAAEELRLLAEREPVDRV